MSGHTPGPWIIKARTDGLANIYHAAGVRDVALCAKPADACLIAAAPEMLEALREAEKTIRRLAACGSLDPRFVAIESQVGIGLIHAAIAKAEGR